MGQTLGNLTSQPNIPPDMGQSPIVSNAPATSNAIGTSPAPPQAPTETKGHKLLQILQSGIQGALAGRAASEQAILQSGGRRAGGAGMGFEAGFTLPWQRAAQLNQLAQQQAQTGVLQSEAQNFNVPGVGPIPGWLAKSLGPAYLRQQGQLGSAQIGATSRENVAGTQQETQQQIHRYIPVPGVGLFDTQTRQNIPDTQQGIMVTPEIAKDHNLPSEFIGKPMKLTDLAAVQRSDVFANVPQMTAQGPIIVNRKTAQATPVQGPGGRTYAPPALAAPREVANPAAPGETTLVPAGQSFGMAGPGSASVQAPRAAATTAAKSAVPTNIGNLKVAFTTAIQHANLLRQAAQALQNGNQQTLSDIKNRFKNEFGSTGPVTAQTIADAYGREVTSMLSKGHMTDSEISSVGKTINPNRQSFDQLNSVIGAYQALAQSKLNMLNQQVNAATGKTNAGGQTAADMLKKYPPKK